MAFSCEDEQKMSNNGLTARANIYMQLDAERTRQDAKFGEQNEPLYVWLAIIGEEFGEVCQAALHSQFGGKAAGTERAELIQLAAVCVSALEAIDRRDDRDDLKGNQNDD